MRTPSRTPGMNEARSNESCRRVSCSPGPPSSTSWCATRPRSRTECTRTPSTSAPRAPSRAVGGGVRDRTEPGVPPRRGEQLGGAPGGAAGRVDLVRVVQLDHLDRLEVRRRLLGEPHQQHRADARSSAPPAPRGRGRRPAPPGPGPASAASSRWCRPRRARRAPTQASTCSTATSGTENTTATSCTAPAAARSSPRSIRTTSVEVAGRLDGAADLLAHPALGADHRDLHDR